MVEVFKTNITDRASAALILEGLHNKIPNAKINFDLEDCDNILRVEDDHVSIQPIIELFQSQGFYCKVLE